MFCEETPAAIVLSLASDRNVKLSGPSGLLRSMPKSWCMRQAVVGSVAWLHLARCGLLSLIAVRGRNLDVPLVTVLRCIVISGGFMLAVAATMGPGHTLFMGDLLRIRSCVGRTNICFPGDGDRAI